MKYSYNQIKELLQTHSNITEEFSGEGISFTTILTEMENIIEDKELDKDSQIWEWSLGDKMINEQFDAAMQVIQE